MKNIGKIIRLAKPLYPAFTISSLLILGSAILTQVFPIIVKLIVDQIELQIRAESGNIKTLILLMLIFLFANVSSIILTAISQRLGDYIGSRLGKFLTETFYKKIFTLPQTYFDSEISGKIVNQLTRGITTIQGFVSAATNFILPSILQSVLTILVLAYFNTTIALLSLVVFPLYISISQYSTKLWGKREVEKNKIEDRARGRVTEVISNIKLVKIFNTQPSEYRFISNSYKKINTIYDAQSSYYHILNFIRNFGLELIIFIIMGVAFTQTFSGILTIGEMVLILQLLNQLRRPLFAMSFILEQIQRAEAGSKEYFEILHLESSESFKPKRMVSGIIKKPSITFKNVSFEYEQKNAILTDISLTFNKFETVALVGHSGAGKSTLINLICRFYEPTDGEILINEKPYSSCSHAYVRNHISLVFQDNELFSSTIRENVAYGLGSVDDKDIISALKKANAYQFVKKLPKGLDSEIGERGVKLSGGQKQRIQIARAILHDAPILILDEATSSLDSKSEKLVQDALDELFKNRLVIIIAHRFSTIQNADRVVVIDQGRIIDNGPSHVLAKKKGIYSDLLKYQIDGNKKLLTQYEIF